MMMKSPSSTDVETFECDQCGMVWNYDPGFSTCPYCEEDNVDGKIIDVTRTTEEMLNEQAERQMNIIKEMS